MQNLKITTQIKADINSKIKKQPFFDALRVLVVALKDDRAYPRIVGGCVRDFLLNKNPEDIDLATTLQPEEVMAKIKAINKTVIPTGLKHGTVTVIIDDYKFEVTTLRIDVKCNGRHAEVAFKKNFKLDAKRRDFTINAMSYCVIRKKLYDYFDGFEHLKMRKVIFIGNADQRIKEDALRILRFFRFSSYYANKIDYSGLESCIKNKHLLKNLSQERITSEFNKILLSKNMKILFSMKEILPEINLSEIDLEKLNKFIIFLKNKNKPKIKLSNELELIYALLFSSIQNPQNQLSKMRLPNAFIKKVQKIIWFEQKITSKGNNKDNNDEDLILFLKLNYKSNEEIYQEIFLLLEFHSIYSRTSDFQNLDLHSNIDKQKLIQLKQWLAKIPNFEITGEDVIKFGISGAEIKKTLDDLYFKWIKNDCKLTKEELLSELVST